MSANALWLRLKEARLPPAVTYGALAFVLLIAAWQALAGLADAYADYSAAGTRLAALEGRGGKAGDPAGDPQDRGSPFLEGPTLTVAGANLQRRVANAVAAAGGSVLSSQVDLKGSQESEGSHTTPGYIVVSANCDLEETALQPLLYDLEAGMPFLFIEQFDAQSSSGESGGSRRIRVQIDVGGQWRASQ